WPIASPSPRTSMNRWMRCWRRPLRTSSTTRFIGATSATPETVPRSVGGRSPGNPARPRRGQPMSDRLKSARKLGLSVPPGYEEYYDLGAYRMGPRDRCNLGILLGRLDDLAGRHCFVLITGVDPKTETEVYTQVLLRPGNPRTADAAADMLST